MFRAIPFKEQAEYLDRSEKKTNRRVLLTDDVKEIEDKMQKCLEEISNLQAMVENNAIEELYGSCASLSRRMVNIATKIGLLPAEYGIKDKKDYINRVVVDKKNVIFNRREDKLQIILPELLPHRPQYDSVNNKMKYMYDIDKWRAGYYSAFSEEFVREKYHIYEEKVCMMFLHHVGQGNSIDVDNFEYKVITDIITLFLLVDDSHRYLSHYMDMIEDGGNYTEIIICPLRRVEENLVQM